MRIFIAALALLCAFGAAATANDRPNVVLILVDDMGLHDLSVEGSTFYRSPNIDSLARGGMRFTQGYATCRVCSPSRASIQLGTFTARHGITNWIGARSGMDWKRDDRLLPAEYDPVRTEAKFRRVHTELKQRLEKTHAAMLDPNWQPNANWWGSLVTQD